MKKILLNKACLICLVVDPNEEVMGTVDLHGVHYVIIPLDNTIHVFLRADSEAIAERDRTLSACRLAALCIPGKFHL